MLYESRRVMSNTGAQKESSLVVLKETVTQYTTDIATEPISVLSLTCRCSLIGSTSKAGANLKPTRQPPEAQRGTILTFEEHSYIQIHFF